MRYRYKIQPMGKINDLKVLYGLKRRCIDIALHASDFLTCFLTTEMQAHVVRYRYIDKMGLKTLRFKGSIWPQKVLYGLTSLLFYIGS